MAEQDSALTWSQGHLHIDNYASCWCVGSSACFDEWCLTTSQAIIKLQTSHTITRPEGI